MLKIELNRKGYYIEQTGAGRSTYFEGIRKGRAAFSTDYLYARTYKTIESAKKALEAIGGIIA